MMIQASIFNGGFIKLLSSINAPEHDTIICEKITKKNYSVNKSLNIMDFCYFIKKNVKNVKRYLYNNKQKNKLKI